VAAKAKAAQRAGLTPILCVGETEAERQAGRAVAAVMDQLAASLPSDVSPGALVVAYEPVWAIGSGRTCSAADITEIHQAIRASLGERFQVAAARIRVLYGGSVKPANAAEILNLRNVDGALIGGASLKAADFLAIIRAAPRR